MKELLVIVIGVLLFVGIIVGGISYNQYVNRNKEHVYSPEEIAAIECAKRGGNPTTRVGWDNDIHIKEYKCEAAK